MDVVRLRAAESLVFDIPTPLHVLFLLNVQWIFGQKLLAVVDVDFGSDSASASASAAAVVVILILVLVIYGTRSLTPYHRMYFFSHGGPRNGHLAPQPVEISKTHHPFHRKLLSSHPNVPFDI